MTPRDLIKDLLLHDLAFDSHELGDAPDANFRITAKAPGILAGTRYIRRVLEVLQTEFFLPPATKLDTRASVAVHKTDGEAIVRGDVIADFYGNAEVLLKVERTLLNILTSCSGIATEVAHDVARVAHTKVRLLDTRKCPANLRDMHKYAVRVGGGMNHRTGFYDGIMVKDNDIDVYGGVVAALDVALRRAHVLCKIEIEVGDVDTIMQVLADKRADIIMLDNMTPAEMKKVVQMIRFETKPYLIEASGIGKFDLVAVAETGVDFISQSSMVSRGLGKPIDMSMKYVK